MSRLKARQLQSFTVPSRDKATVRGRPTPDGSGSARRPHLGGANHSNDHMDPGEKMRIRPQMPRGLTRITKLTSTFALASAARCEIDRVIAQTYT